MLAPARAAAVVAAAIAGTALVPFIAHAESQPLLRVELGTPASSGPLTRGGATETFELTVENPGTEARQYHPWLLLDEAGPSPLQTADITYRVEPVNAPATAVLVGHQDGGWQGMFHPASGSAGDGFQVPAGSELTWKVTIGLTKSYPTINGGFELTAASVRPELERPDTLAFDVAPNNEPGTFRTWMDRTGGCEGLPESQCQGLDLHYKVGGHGTFNHAVRSQLIASYGDSKVRNAGLVVEAKVDGGWKAMKGDDFFATLPTIQKGFGVDSGERVVPLRIKLAADTAVTGPTPITLRTETLLDAGNNYPFAGTTDTKITLGPVKASPTPTTIPSTTPSTTPSVTPSISSSAAAPVPSAPSTPSAGATQATTGSLATTGSDSTTSLYAALAAAALVALGSLAWFTTRRSARR
ncbi:hypothetical protein [Streptomyces sp. NPDC058463]|uniref:hypothetical protein n=1 Tax=Streptomyces sp. NPDC058463 TaxID=3346510 RepID=UPI003666D093